MPANKCFMNTLLYILFGVVAIIILWLTGVYNSLVRLNNKTKEAWSDIDVQLKRRHDLIPNLVETVKGYAKHEASTFEKVTYARAQAIQAKNPKDAAQAENALSETLKSLFAVAENYPELKANLNFQQLQTDLRGTEDKIESSRRYYNANVRDFNTKIEVFPNNLVAGMLKFKKYDYYEVAGAEERENVRISF